MWRCNSVAASENGGVAAAYHGITWRPGIGGESGGANLGVCDLKSSIAAAESVKQ